jgi:hypothetical protein
MAVDTADKRASVLGLGLAALLVLPSPGLIDQPDRQHVAYSYRGIEADNPIVITGDEVTASEGYFARAVTGQESYFARAVTSEDAER